MILRVNGEEKTFVGSAVNIAQLLETLGLQCRRTAVEINGVIIDPDLFDATRLQDRDAIEIVSFVGGG
jgi:thiamine biosynthesis protein ThiS